MDIKRLTLALTYLSLIACSTQQTKPVKEELYFKNYAFVSCLAAAFDDKELGEDINGAINGYTERGSMSLDTYRVIDSFADSWVAEKNYESKHGGQINTAKCLDLYSSDELKNLYEKHTPCKSSKYWYSKEKYTKNCT